MKELSFTEPYVNEPVCWKGDNLSLQRSRFVLPQELEEALKKVLQDEQFAADGPVSDFADVVHNQLDWESGFCIVDGLEKFCVDLDEYVRVTECLGEMLGTLVQQNLAGDKIVLVRDDGHTTENPNNRGHKSSDGLGFHNDRCDIIGLACYAQSDIGGESTLVSAKYVHDIIGAARPDLLAQLYGVFPNHRRGEEREGEDPWCSLPVFASVNGEFVCRFVKRFIIDSQTLPDAPRLTAKQIEALDFMEQVIEDPDNHFRFKLREGQVLILNNHVLLHGRSHFKDKADKKRTLVRVWLANKQSRPLPEAFIPLYRNVSAGAVRGGI
ncbi:hypothetical protein GCM10007385_31680 [Tateyamaria omphalii]|uniref:TauD/TfdA family dioxygenase n=1 Tax=Tateyamaria omphalii TaxID=299262 RepID=UPI00167A944F|nr:TauD/TfdA family dioxygenase [Tateyamaria omphalii]GGX60091.1 hypothetical protein GCM10007385_31680 [Tateyamaria omphalii]